MSALDRLHAQIVPTVVYGCIMAYGLGCFLLDAFLVATGRWGRHG